MDPRYKIVTDGKLREGVEPEQFVSAFVQTFKIPEAQARKLLTAERPVVLKDNLDRETAEKFQRVLMEQTGLEVRLEAKDSGLSLVSGNAAPAETQPQVSATQNTAGRCPKCGSDRVQGDDCLACGVIISRYRARQAQMAEETSSSYYAPPSSKVLPEREEPDDGEPDLHKVEIGSGWRWVVGGWQLFVRNPVAWIVAIIIWYVILIAASLIPIIGPLGLNVLSPVFVAGLMLGAREQSYDGDFTIGHLFAGFSTEFSKLLQAGLLYLAAGMVVGIIAAIFIMAIGFSAMSQHAPPASFDTGISMVLILILVLVLAIVMAIISMAFWYLPLLVVFDGKGPIEALTLSFSACWKNAIPLLIYGIMAFGLALVAMIPLGLGLLVLAPVLVASMYVSYRAIFHGGE